MYYNGSTLVIQVIPLTITDGTRKFFSCPDFFEGQSKWKRHLVLLRVFQVHLVATFTESYLLQRFWREGWIFNLTIQKLIGTNTVIGISSGLPVKL